MNTNICVYERKNLCLFSLCLYKHNVYFQFRPQQIYRSSKGTSDGLKETVPWSEQMLAVANSIEVVMEFREKQAIAKILFFFLICFEVFAEKRRKNSILVIVRAFWIVREVESYAPSKFQPPTTLGDHQNVEKTIREKIYFLGFGN